MRSAPPIEVHNSRIHGYGVFAARRIRPGQLVMEYIGEIIDADEAYSRYVDDEMERHHTFLFALDDGSFIDAGRTGNEARYINHSCEPNCEAEEVDGRILIYALRNVQPGAELTYDYRLHREGRRKASWKKLYECRCGSPACRGTMLKPSK